MARCSAPKANLYHGEATGPPANRLFTTQIGNRAMTTTTQDFDPYSADGTCKGPEFFGELGRKCPVHHYRGRFDFFVVSDPADVRKSVLVDPEKWSIEKGNGPGLIPEQQRTGLISDDAYHFKIRNVIQRGFSSTELLRLKGIVEDLANELIDAMEALPERRGDFFELFAMPLPARLMCLMLGAPEAEWKSYKAWADQYFFNMYNDNQFDGQARTTGTLEITASLFAAMSERRALLEEKGLAPDLSLLGTVLPNDFMSRFICEQIDGTPFSPAEVLSMMMGIIIGGNETTMNLIANLVWRLLEVPSRWEAIKANPDLIEAAIEESLRLDPPVLGMFRTPNEDIVLQGETIPKDHKVMYNIAAVNRDPAIWEDPEEFRLDRSLSSLRKHVAFSGGHHMCLGAPLARMEVKRVMELLIARLPNLRIDGKDTRAPGMNVHGRVHIPVRWDPVAP